MARAQLLCLIGAACLLIAVAGVAAKTPPTLPEGWSGNCNSTVTVPFLGPTTLVGKCYFDGVGKRTRQDGTMSTPFGKVVMSRWSDGWLVCYAGANHLTRCCECCVVCCGTLCQTAYDVHWWHETFDQCVALQVRVV